MTSLQSVNGRGKFAGCTKLESVKFPSSIESIGGACCRYTKIHEITIPENVISLAGNESFADCRNLKKMIIRSNKISTGPGSNFLANTPIAAGEGYIYVPDDSVDRYKAFSGLSPYASQIKPLSEYVE